MFAAPAALKRWLDNGGAQHPERLCRKTEAGASAAAASTPLTQARARVTMYPL